jgi:hypothetical protein
MYKIANLSKDQRAELFSETATLMNTTNGIVEKDFWVVWTLAKIFEDERLNKILMFKGGTSLSKVFNLIGRFSEDIDLILDWRLVTKENPLKELTSKNKQVKFNEQINENAKLYIKDELLPIISEILSPLCTCNIADVAIEFTAPTVAYNNYINAFNAGVKVVSGSTGWNDGISV